MDRPRVSVVVSTCNRAEALRMLFDALDRQTANGRIAWELVVVDNRSTDDTSRVIEDLARRARFPVKALFEPRQGKSHGLNAGIAAARGELIAFTDDDGVPAPDWLERLLAHFEAHTDAGCVGGRVELYDAADAPITIRPSREPCMVDASTFAAFDIPVIGCNMAIRATLLEQLGPYDVCIGPGGRAGTAEDVDMLYRLVATGHRIHYDPEIVVLHNHGRRSAEELARVRTSYLVGRGAFYCKHALRADWRVIRWAYWEFRALAAQALRGGLVTRAARASLSDMRLIATGGIRYLRFRERPAPAMARTANTHGATNA
ncbi:MAG: glycosyltransferase family 2 protein [Burkholderiaceae bacterium]|nr:glycosyltransferase family 2 protein [Burkholderiaceae bacterium]